MGKIQLLLVVKGNTELFNNTVERGRLLSPPYPTTGCQAECGLWILLTAAFCLGEEGNGATGEIKSVLLPNTICS